LQDFRNLKFWQKGHQLTLSIYQTTRTFPKEELYGLTSQIRRSSASIPTNIIEGCGRGTDKKLARFLQISLGASELEYHLLLARDLNIIELNNYESLHKNLL
jgi:four helix bundle protein